MRRFKLYYTDPVFHHRDTCIIVCPEGADSGTFLEGIMKAGFSHPDMEKMTICPSVIRGILDISAIKPEEHG